MIYSKYDVNQATVELRETRILFNVYGFSIKSFTVLVHHSVVKP